MRCCMLHRCLHKESDWHVNEKKKFRSFSDHKFSCTTSRRSFLPYLLTSYTSLTEFPINAHDVPYNWDQLSFVQFS